MNWYYTYTYQENTRNTGSSPIMEQKQEQQTRAASESLPLSTSLFTSTEICSYFPTQPFTATRFWQNHLPQIIQASHNPHIPELQTPEEETKLHTLLKTILTPARMRRGVRHMPTFENGHNSVKRVIEIIENRIRDPDKYPPLRIAVFGGSVTIGRGCHGRGMGNHNCAWPMRFELLVNQFAKQYYKEVKNNNKEGDGDDRGDNTNNQEDQHDHHDIVKVYNLGVGGTGTPVGTNMVKYWMYPAELAKVGPDVIVNSYSTNDSLPPWGSDVRDQVNLVMENVRNSLQTFIRTAMVSKRCEVPPLVVHMDDYLGPQQDAALGELSYSTAMTQMAKWYDTVAISYGDVVRDLAWHEGDETFYNPKDVHFGHWAHQTIAWSMGFASLELLSNYCDDEYVARSKMLNQTQANKEDALQIHHGASNTSATITADIDIGKDGNGNVTNSVLLQKNHLFLPPALTRKTMLKQSAIDFTTALETARKSYTTLNCSAKNESSKRNSNHTEEGQEVLVLDMSPCIVSWIATPGGFDAGSINRFMKKNSRTSGKPIDGWQTEKNMKDGWSNKIGWVANKANATFTLQFDNIQKDVNAVTIFFLRSYGEKWENSRAKFLISRVTKEETKGADGDGDGRDSDGTNVFLEDEISGVHNDTHSLTLSQELNLSDTIHKGENLSIKVDLLSGSTFKIMGMMICT